MSWGAVVAKHVEELEGGFEWKARAPDRES